MELSDLISVIGLLIDISGACLMFFNTPKIDSHIYLFSRSEEKEIVKKANQKQERMRLGMILLIIGFVFQSLGVILN